MEFGGLGIRRIIEINKALPRKWIWNFGITDGKLWKKIIVDKYGTLEGARFTKRNLTTHGCSLWRGIMDNVSIVQDNMNFVLGNGQRLRFWTDSWCEGTVLAEEFHDLFLISQTQHGTVAQYKSCGGDRDRWKIGFRRRLYEWEESWYAVLLQKLEGMALTEEEDSRIWRDGSQNYSPRVVFKQYERVRIDEEQTTCTDFPVKSIWIPIVPSKVCFVIGALIRGRSLSSDNLRKRGRAMPLKCIMCDREEEISQHLFISCVTSTRIWNWILSAFGTQIDTATELQG